MLKQPTILVFYLCLFFCVSCSQATQKEPEKKAVSKKSVSSIPKAENGITIVSEKGWSKDEMDFQQRYCEDMMASMEEIDGFKFCSCFLEKIQYYYKPIHAREAFTDQKKWNQTCFELAEK